MKIRALSTIKIVVTIAIIGQFSPAQTASKCRADVQGKSEPKIYSTSERVSTPESKPIIQLGVNKLEELINLANPKKLISEGRIYSLAIPELKALKVQGLKLLNDPYPDQNEVASFFYRLSLMIDLPVDYLNEIGRHADGFGWVYTYTEKEHRQRLKALDQRYDNPQPEKELIPDLLTNAFGVPKFDLQSPFFRRYVRDDLVAEVKYPFQYKHIYINHLFTLREGYAERESGEVKIGVSFKSKAPYDGQFGTSNAFTEHDTIHAFIWKWRDQQFFDHYKIKTTQEMAKAKKNNQKLLTNRIKQIDQIQNKHLKDAIDIGMFAYLHEDGFTYPFGVAQAFRETGEMEYMRNAIIDYVKTNRAGKENFYLHTKPEIIAEALAWIKKAAEEDLTVFNQSFSMGRM